MEYPKENELRSRLKCMQVLHSSVMLVVLYLGDEIVGNRVKL